MRRVGLAQLGLVLALCVLSGRRAQACAGCSVGDATLTVAGAEQPFAGRLRSAAELRYRSDAIGSAGFDRMNIRELRADLSLAWAPRQDLFVIADVPWLYRRVVESNLAQSESVGVGELELGAKWFFLRDRAFAPRWLLAISGGLKLPTSSRRSTAGGQPLPLEAQAGSGSADLLFGPSLTAFLGRLSGVLTARWREVLWSPATLEPGRSLDAGVALQWQCFEALALRGVSDLRWAQSSRERGAVDPNSGGYVSFLGAELVLGAPLETSISAGLRLPALNRLHGAHSEGPSINLALVRDW